MAPSGMEARYSPWLFGFAWFSGGAVLAEPQADASGVRLSWVRGEGAESCLAADDLERDVGRRLGYSPFEDEARQWIEGSVTKGAEGYRAQLFERDRDGKALGRRELTETTGSCAQLGEAVSLAVALIIAPNATLLPVSAPPPPPSERAAPPPPPMAPPSPPPAEAKAPAPQASTAPASTPPAPVPQRHHDRTNPSLSLLGGLRAWTFPDPSAMVEFAVSAAFEPNSPLGYRVGMLYVPENRVDDSRANISYGMTSGMAAVCATSTGSLRATGCFGLEGGAWHAVVHDPNPYDAGEHAWLAGRLELGGEATLLGPFSLQARLVGAVPLTRWTFRVRIDGEPQPLYEQRLLEPAALLGIGMRFF